MLTKSAIRPEDDKESAVVSQPATKYLLEQREASSQPNQLAMRSGLFELPNAVLSERRCFDTMDNSLGADSSVIED